MNPEHFDPDVMDTWCNRVFTPGRMLDYTRRADPDAGDFVVDDRTGEDLDSLRGYPIDPWRHFPGEGPSYIERLRSGPAVVRSTQELVGGVPCFVVDAHTKHGDYTVWFDASRGCVLRAEGVRTREQLDSDPSEDDPAKQRIERRTVLYDVRVQQFGTLWLAVEGSVQQTTQFGDGYVHVFHGKLKRDRIELNPDFSKIEGAFTVNIPNGTRAYLYGVRDGIRYERNDGIVREWRDGQVVPVIDQAMLGDLNQQIAQERDAFVSSTPNPWRGFAWTMLTLLLVLVIFVATVMVARAGATRPKARHDTSGPLE